MTQTREQGGTSAVDDGGWRDLARHGGPVVVMAGGVLLNALNAYVTSALLPSVVTDFGGRAFYAWATTAFAVTSVVAAMLVSQVLARLGVVGGYVLAFATFVSGTALAAVAPGMAVLLTGRAVQGFGGGLLAGLAWAVLRRVLPERLWARALGLLSAMYAVGILAGPPLGGAFAQLDAWRLAFVTVAAAGIGLAVLAARALRGTTRERTAPEPVPVGSLVLLTAATAALSLAGVAGSTAATAGLLTLAALLAVAFVAWERRAASTVLPRSTYDRSLPVRWIYLALVAVSLAAVTEAFTPYFGQQIGGLAPLVAGFFGAAVSVGWTATNLAAASVRAERLKTIFMLVGPGVVAGGLVAGALVVSSGSGGWSMLAWGGALALAGAGIGVSFPQYAVRLMTVVEDEEESSKAAAGINTVELLAMSTGSAVGGVLVNSGLPDPVAAAVHLQVGLAVLVGLGTVAAVRAVRPRRPLPLA